jgi:hypothetical protein
MPASPNRRSFLKQTTAAAGAAWAAGSYFVSQSPAQVTKSTGDTLNVAVMGVNGRGSALATGFIGQPNCQIAYICDVDERAINKVMSPIAEKQSIKPQGVADFRKALDDKSVDILARAGDDSGLCRRQARLCREAVQPQPARRRTGGGGLAQAQPRGANGEPAAEQPGPRRRD